MVKLPRRTARAAFVGLIAFAVVFLSASLGGRVFSSPLPVATAPSLGSAGSFAVLGGSAVTNTGATVITGDLGVSPGTSVSGFPPGIVTGTIHAADAVALQAQSDVTTAYNNLAGQAVDVDLTGTDLGGLTLVPGVYSFSSSAQLTGALTLDAQGSADAVWVFRIGSTLTTASNASVSVINGGTNCNVFWQVGSSATLGTTTTFVGNILALTSITLNTSASISGRALARNGAVTLDTNNISNLECAAVAPTSTATPVPETPTTTPGPETPTTTPGPESPTATPGPQTPTATPDSAPYGEVQVGKFTGSDCTSDLQPEAGVKFSIGTQDFFTGRVGPGIDRQIIAAGINKVEMLGQAGWRTCVRVIDPFEGETLRQEFGDGETVLVDVPVYDSRTTEVYVANLIVAGVSTSTPTPVTATSTPATATSTPATTTSTPSPTQQSPAPAVETIAAAAPTATPELAQTPNVVMPATLPRTGGPSGMVSVWLALGGAGVALLVFSMRRRSR